MWKCFMCLEGVIHVVVMLVGLHLLVFVFFFFQAEDGIRDVAVTGVQTCALPICAEALSEPPSPAMSLYFFIPFSRPTRPWRSRRGPARSRRRTRPRPSGT